MESLVCTVKRATIEGDRATCSVFVLCGPVELVGRHLIQNRDGKAVGSWKVESTGSEWILIRQEGPDLEECDYMFGDLPTSEPPPPPSKVDYGHYLVFEGKNWKLASEKKWREKMINIGGFEHVGDAVLKGKPHKILRGEGCFVAVPDASPSSPSPEA